MEGGHRREVSNNGTIVYVPRTVSNETLVSCGMVPGKLSKNKNWSAQHTSSTQADLLVDLKPSSASSVLSVDLPGWAYILGKFFAFK